MTLPKSSLQRFNKGFFTPEKNPSKIIGSFEVDTGVCNIIEGTGWTVAYTGAGIYTITTTSINYSNLISATATVQGAGAGLDMYVDITSFVCAAGAVTTMIFSTLTGAVVTELPNNDFIHFELNLVSGGTDA